MELAALPLLLLLLGLPRGGPGRAAAQGRLSDADIDNIMNLRDGEPPAEPRPEPPAEPGPRPGASMSANMEPERQEFTMVTIELPNGTVVELAEGKVVKLADGIAVTLSKGEVVELAEGDVVKLPDGKVIKLSKGEVIELPEGEDGPNVPKEKPPKTPQRLKGSEKEEQEKLPKEKAPKGSTGCPKGSDKNKGKTPKKVEKEPVAAAAPRQDSPQGPWSPPWLPPRSYEEDEYEEEEGEWWPGEAEEPLGLLDAEDGWPLPPLDAEDTGDIPYYYDNRER